MKPQDFIGEKAIYDEQGFIIWGVHKDDSWERLADIRGWGSIQHLFKDEKGLIDDDAAAKFQDDLGRWIVAAINEKLERERQQKNTQLKDGGISNGNTEVITTTKNSLKEAVKKAVCSLYDDVSDLHKNRYLSGRDREFEQLSEQKQQDVAKDVIDYLTQC